MSLVNDEEKHAIIKTIINDLLLETIHDNEAYIEHVLWKYKTNILQ